MPAPFRKPIHYPFRRGLVQWITLLSFSFWFAGPSAFAENPNFREYIYKASYIYNFTKFVKWPEKTRRQIQQNGLNLCLMGEDPFGEILDQTSQKLLRKGEILNIKRGITFDKFSQCAVLFISSSEKSRLSEIVKRTRTLPILLIGDSPGFARQGIGINFFLQEGNIRFEINEKAIERSGLKVSSDLLDLSRSIEE